MKIYTENAEEYIAVILSICGEIEQERILNNSPFAKGSVYRAIKDLRAKKVLVKHKYDDGRIFLRISSLGEEAIRNLSPFLLSSAKNLVNEDLKYSGAKETRLKERNNYELYHLCLEKGIKVNEFECEYRAKKPFEERGEMETTGKSIFSPAGDPLPLETIAENIDESYTGLLTKRVIKKREIKKGSRSSRISGTLVLKGQIYQAYVLGDPETTAWIAEAEHGAANYITGTVERCSKEYKDQGFRIANNCILLYPTPEFAEKMILTADGKDYRIDPCRIYSESYINPSYCLSDAKIKLYGTPSWQKKLTSLLFPGSIPTEITDGMTAEGQEIHNFVGSELEKIRRTARRLSLVDKKAVLVIEPWMERNIHKVFNSDRIETVEISESDLSILADSIS